MKYRYKIDKIVFNEGTELSPGALTVIVGPNNSGKSRVLKDILELITKRNPHTIVAKDINFDLPGSINILKDSYNIEPYIDIHNNYFLKQLQPTMLGSDSIGIMREWETYWDSLLKRFNNENKREFCEWFGKYFIAFLRTEDRLKLVNEVTTQGMNSGISSPLQSLYFDQRETEKKLNDVINDAFNISIRLDESGLEKLSLRVGESFDRIPPETRKARPLLTQYEKLDDQGDGIKSFVATVLSMIVIERPITLIDEPEAFLHPPQAMKLGEFIGKYAIPNHQTIIVTHSSDLLKGILSKRTNISVIRIDRTKNQNRIYQLDPLNLEKVLNNPLLSSSRILDAIFYKGAVIVEGDSDSVFYQRVSRIMRNSDDIHYAHAYNKQTVYKVSDPYKKMGIKFAIIVDFDVLRDKNDFSNLISEMTLPNEKIEELLEIREGIQKEVESINPSQQMEMLINAISRLNDDITRFDRMSDPAKNTSEIKRRLKRILEDSTLWRKYKDEGYLALKEEGQKDFLRLSEICKQHGIFIVPYGELESWLTPYGIEKTSNKSNWIVTALMKLPEISTDRTKPLWDFITDIHDYLLG